MKLLVVSSDTFPPTRVDVSVLFGEELAGRGHRIDWILQSEGACARAYKTPWGGGDAWVGPTDLRESRLGRARKHWLSITHDMKLFALLRTGKYDVIQIKDKFISGAFAAMAARRSGARFVYWLSYPFPEAYLEAARDGTARYPLLYRMRGQVFKFLLYKVLLPAADWVFVQSEQMRRDLAAEGVPLSKMSAVPMGIRTKQASLASCTGARTVIPPGERCFLYLGTLIKVRRLDFLIRVLARVRETIPDAKLYIVGRGDDPSDEQLLADEAQRLNVQSAVVMVGQLPQPEALRYVQDADVCVSPFYPTPILNSTSPTKLVEYMSLGKAVVANDHPEQRLVLEESGGGLCVPYEEQAFAAAVVRLLQSPQLVREMGELGRKYVFAHRTYERIAGVVEQDLKKAAMNR